MERLSKKKSININSFRDYEPLLFLGNTVFHSNKPISSNVDCHRLTLLAHYFDPFPKYSVGSLLRKIRFRWFFNKILITNEHEVTKIENQKEF